jgi:hypothetical protein
LSKTSFGPWITGRSRYFGFIRIEIIGDSGCLAVCGGSGIYHIQIANIRGDWCEAIDPNGADDQVDVWLSDQGFATSRKLTWPLKDATELVRYYFDNRSKHPGYAWR